MSDQRSAATAFTTVDRAPMPLQTVSDAKEWWDMARKQWLYNHLARESKGLPLRRLAEYAAERAHLLNQELPPDPWGSSSKKEMSSASVVSEA